MPIFIGKSLHAETTKPIMENTNLTIENLRSNSLFKYISDSDLQKISKTLKEETFSAGTVIFNENTRGGRLYLILEGKVKISKITKYGMETSLAILGKGRFFWRNGVDRRPVPVGKNHSY